MAGRDNLRVPTSFAGGRSQGAAGPNRTDVASSLPAGERMWDRRNASWPATRSAELPDFRVMSCNGEWMNNFFGADGEPAAWLERGTLDDARFSVEKAAGALARMVAMVDPDVIAFQEAPSRAEELQLFLDRVKAEGGPDLAFVLGDSGGAQKLAVCWRVGAIEGKLAPADGLSELLGDWDSDIDGDGVLKPYHFTRQPLVVDLSIGGSPLQMISVHTKSSFVNKGEELWENEATRQQYVVAALSARRRNSSEGMRLRRYLDRRLVEDPKAPIIVAGDLNDGPGLDYFEERYLTHNVTDILVGSAYDPERLFVHALHDVPKADRYTAVFDDFVTGEKDRQLLLDHLLVSPGLTRRRGLRRVDGSGTVHHAEWSAQTTSKGSKRDQRPSDHRPVSVVLAK